MKPVHRIIAITSLAFAAIAGVMPALAATTDPLQLLYRVAGAQYNQNVQLVITCTNVSSVTENLQVLLRDGAGAVNFNSSTNLASFETWFLTYSGVGVPAFTGYAAIGATTNLIFCDVGLTGSINRGLHMQRYNPIPGTLE